MSTAAAPLPDRLGGAPDGKRALRLWLRLLTCTTTIEQTIAQRLRDEFGSTLPRFDMLSALDRAGEAGLTMGEVSRMLMVSNGNVTEQSFDAVFVDEADLGHATGSDRERESSHIIKLATQARSAN